MRCGVEDAAQLKSLLDLFFGYEREEIADFRKAVEQFKTDLPEVLKALREMIETAERDNQNFRKAALRCASSSMPRTQSTRASPPPTCARC